MGHRCPSHLHLGACFLVLVVSYIPKAILDFGFSSRGVSAISLFQISSPVRTEGMQSVRDSQGLFFPYGFNLVALLLNLIFGELCIFGNLARSTKDIFHEVDYIYCLGLLAIVFNALLNFLLSIFTTA